MSIFHFNNCKNEFNNVERKPFSLPCNDIICEKCLCEIYDKQNLKLICPIHKKEFLIEFNKIPICSKILNDLKNLTSKDIKDLSLFCVRHKKNKIKFFCEQDKTFLCDTCITKHNGHKYIEFKLNKDNFANEIGSLKNNFENIKNKYLIKKNKINKIISLSIKHIDEQILKINNYFNNLINIINEIKSSYILKVNNATKENIKKFEKIQNIFSMSDEKYCFINNEFYYINKDLLSKGEYETYNNLKNNFIKEIQNFEKYININIFCNKDLFNFSNNKLPIYISPKNGLIGKTNSSKEEDIFGKFDDILIDINLKKNLK